MMHVIVARGCTTARSSTRHTVGFEALAAHVERYTPAWAADVTGVPAERIVALARRYATTRPAMIVLGGSSMHKGATAGRARAPSAACPRSPATSACPGGGFGPRHGGATPRPGARQHRRRRGPAPRRADDVPNQMPRMTEALLDARACA